MSDFTEWITRAEQNERLQAYKTYESYYNGDHGVAIPQKVKEALQSELGTVINYCQLAITTVRDYIAGGVVGAEVKGNDATEGFVYDVFDANYFWDENLLKILTVMTKLGDVFVKLYIEDGRIKLTVLSPENVYPRYLTNDYNAMRYCAIKWWEDVSLSPTTEKLWKAQVFGPNVVEYYTLGPQGGNWQLDKVEDNVLGFIPIIHIKNTVDTLEYGVSDLQPLIGIQDAMNKTITDMLLTMDQQAFQRVWVWGAQSPRGHKISMEPGTITEVPDPTGHIDVIQSNDITPYLASLKELQAQFLTVGSLSKLPIVEPEVSHPASGFALKVRTIPLEKKCDTKCKILQNRLNELCQMIFKAASIMGIGNYSGKVIFHFASGLPEDQMTRAQVDEIYNRMMVKSRRTIAEEQGIESPDAEFQELMKEQLWLNSMMPQPQTSSGTK